MAPININHALRVLYTKESTWLPTKDETSETSVQNLSGLFPYIHDCLQL